MAEKDIVPQWLKEVLKRGYQPKKIYQIFQNDLFGYIRCFSASVKTFPNKLIFTLEGIPGSGKTSILNMLGMQKGIKPVSQIIPQEPRFDQEESQLFYQRSEELKTATALSALNDLSSWIATTLALWLSIGRTTKSTEQKPMNELCDGTIKV